MIKNAKRRKKGQISTIADLHPDPRNARRHTPQNVGAIVNALNSVGAARSIVIDEDGTILAGNATVRAAGEAGIQKVQVVESDGKTLVAVRRSGLTAKEKASLAILDNRASELAEWDEPQLASLVADFDLNVRDLAFEQAEFDLLIGKEPPAIVEDELPSNVPQRCACGDLWQLGGHRLLCGDCREASNVAQLLDGQKINVAVTSPPYASQRKYDESSGFKPIPPDEYVAWWDLVQQNVKAHLADDGSFFVNIKEACEDGQRQLYVKELTIAHARLWGWSFVDEFVWTHGGTPTTVIRRFKNGWEPIFHFAKNYEFKFRPETVMHKSESAVLGFKENGQVGKSGHPREQRKQGGTYRRRGESEGMGGMGGMGDAIGARAAGVVGDGMAYPSNVLSVGKNGDALGHSAAFPVGLPSFFIKAFSDTGDTIYEPFCGSGTTIIAAEQLGRRCFGIEISPKYCDVIICRWEKFTGKSAEKIDV